MNMPEEGDSVTIRTKLGAGSAFPNNWFFVDGMVTLVNANGKMYVKFLSSEMDWIKGEMDSGLYGAWIWIDAIVDKRDIQDSITSIVKKLSEV